MTPEEILKKNYFDTDDERQFLIAKISMIEYSKQQHMNSLTMAEIIEAIKAATPEEMKQLKELLLQIFPDTTYSQAK